MCVVVNMPARKLRERQASLRVPQTVGFTFGPDRRFGPQLVLPFRGGRPSGVGQMFLIYAQAAIEGTYGACCEHWMCVCVSKSRDRKGWCSCRFVSPTPGEKNQCHGPICLDVVFFCFCGFAIFLFPRQDRLMFLGRREAYDQCPQKKEGARLCDNHPESPSAPK